MILGNGGRFDVARKSFAVEQVYKVPLRNYAFLRLRYSASATSRMA